MAKSERPYAQPLLTDDRKIVRKLEKDPWNRLRSISQDAQWVHKVALGLPSLPVIGKQNCRANLSLTALTSRTDISEYPDLHQKQLTCDAAHGTSHLRSLLNRRASRPTATSSPPMVMPMNGASA